MKDDAITKALEFICGSYRFGVIQDTMNLLYELADNGIEPKEFVDYVKQKIVEQSMLRTEGIKNAKKFQSEYRFSKRVCPKCGGEMQLNRTNTFAGNQVGEGLQSVWQCLDWYNCGEEEYSTSTVEEEAKKHGLPMLQDSADQK